MTRQVGRYQGREAICTAITRADGTVWLATRGIGDPLLVLERSPVPPGPLRTVAWGDRQLTLTGTEVPCRLEARGLWPGVQDLFAHAMDGGVLTDAQIAAFVQTGLVPFAARFDGDTARICTCTGVRVGQVHQAVATGCESLADLQQRLGCGTVCGGCVPLLQDVVSRKVWTLVRLVDDEIMGPSLRRIGLRPLAGTLPTVGPDQHVLVQGRIGGQWVERPYGVSPEAGIWHLDVTDQPGEVFARWLFHHASVESLLRCRGLDPGPHPRSGRPRPNPPEWPSGSSVG